MRRPVSRTCCLVLSLGVLSLGALAACTDSSGETLEPLTSSGAEIIDSAVDTTGSTVEPPAPATQPATTQPPTTEAEPVGDGPVLTSPGAGDGLVPVFFALEATTTIDCTTANPGTAELRWEVIGTETVDIAIGSAAEIFQLAQPPAGTLDVPLDCADGSTYFVVASNPEGSTTRSVTLAADSTG